MRPHGKTKDQLIKELAAVHQRLSQLEALETERRQAKDEAEKSRNYARNLIESSLDMIIAVDPNRRIMEFNRAARETFGYSKEEVLGQHIDMLYADPADGQMAHDEARRTGGFTGEILNRKKSGETFPAFLAASVLREPNGRFVGVMGISRDISERKQAEQALKRQARIDRQRMQVLDEASRTTSDLLGTMSQELRTRLHAIIGFSELVKDERLGALNEQQRRYVGHVLASARHLLIVINDILGLGGLEAGGDEPQQESLFLSEEFRRDFDRLRLEAVTEGLEHQLSLPLQGTPSGP